MPQRPSLFPIKAHPPPHLPAVDADILRMLSRILPLWALGSEGGLARSQFDALEADQYAFREFHPILAGARFWDWQKRPLDPAAVAALAGLEAKRPFLPGAAKILLGVLTKRLIIPEDISLWEAVKASGDMELAAEFLATMAKDPHHGPYWLGRTFTILASLPDPEAARRILNGPALTGLDLIRKRLQAEFEYLRGEKETALHLWARLPGDIWGHFASHAASILLEDLGDPGGAVLAAQLWRAMPWHVNLTLALHDRLNPAPPVPPPGPDHAAVLLYSMNKAEILRETLAALAATDLGESMVIALDNGSTDATPDVLGQAAALFAPGRFKSVTLPANAGAPGARNWLLSLPETKCCAFAAFLDDDARPPKDWLRRLLAEAARNPQAGAVGCSIVDDAKPHLMQTADVNLLPQAMAPQDADLFKERIVLFDACQGEPDHGLFAYSRPCLSVSGCCHLLRMQAVETAGAFDVRFNPTQFDDLERDMRSFRAGFPSVYAGALKVRHMQFSSMRQPESAAKLSHILGNKIKLESLFTEEEIAALCNENHAALWRDLLRKSAELCADRPPGTPST